MKTLLIAAAVAGVLLGAGVQQVRLSHAQAAQAQAAAQFADYRAAQETLNAQVRAEALVAERTATAREHALAAQLEQQEADARHAQTQYQTNLDAAHAAAGSLREQLATVARGYRALRDAPDHAAGAVRERAAAADAVGMLADLLAGADARAGALAAFADAAHAAGAACERAWASARGALNTPMNTPVLGLKSTP